MWSGVVMMKHPVSNKLRSLFWWCFPWGFWEQNSNKLQWELFYVVLFLSPLKTSTLGVLVAGRGGGRASTADFEWPTEAKVWGTEVVIIVSQKFLSGHREAPRRMCAIQSHGSAVGDCLIPPFLWGWYGPQEMWRKKWRRL